MTNQETVDQIINLFEEYGDYFTRREPLVRLCGDPCGQLNCEKFFGHTDTLHSAKNESGEWTFWSYGSSGSILTDIRFGTPPGIS